MDRFVVGSGRCGSTLLSRMLAQHPKLLSLSEFFNGLDLQRRFAPELSGETLAELISAEQPFVTAVLRRGYPVAEVTYPFDRPGARFRSPDALPWILVSTLPSLTADPDGLYDETLDWVRSQPARAAADQYRALFSWWAEQLGKSAIWVERAGSSIEYLGELQAQFPEARFVHLRRDGREVALSMREHHAYRLAVTLRYNPPTDGFDLFADPTDEDPVTRILRSRPEPALFGRYWSDQMLAGQAAMDSIDAHRIHEVEFEALIDDPRRVLHEIHEFFELGSDDWSSRAATLVDRKPSRRFPDLPEEQAEALQAAVRRVDS